MYEYCLSHPEAKVISFETNRKWFEKMKKVWGNLQNYEMRFISHWDELKKLNGVYDLVFVDQSPWQARIDSIDLLKDKSKTFILHDYDFFNKFQNPWVLEPCKNIYVNDETSWLGGRYMNDFVMEDNYEILPPTLIMRNKIR